MDQADARANVAKCPQCKYDLRAQVGAPVPAMVTCPECGAESSTKELLEPLQAGPARVALGWWLVLPMPMCFFLLLVMMQTGNDFGEVMFFLSGPIYLLLVFVHIITMIVMAAKRGGPSGWDRFEVGFMYFVWTLLYDGAITIGLIFLFLSMFEMH